MADNAEEYEDAPKGLRAQLEATLAKLKEAEDTISSYKTKERISTVEAAVTAKGLNPKVAKLIPSEVETTDALEEWLNDYAEVFGYTADNNSSNPKPTFDQGEVNAAARLQQLANTGQAPSRLDDLSSRLAAATTEEEISRITQDSKGLFL